ncbi:MAG: TraR/DksA family transcriptional regulator [Ectobacillus sp.]
MNAAYNDIRKELELMRRELRSRLDQEKHNLYLMEMGGELFEGLTGNQEQKRRTVLHHIQQDLKDVERALFKMDIGMYGICEETGQPLSLEQLRIIPTACTVHEFVYERLKTV